VPPSVGVMDEYQPRSSLRGPRSCVEGPRSCLGVPLWVVLGLALLAVPRVVLHDLEVSVDPLLQALLAIGPPVIWVVVAVRAQVPSPVLTLVTVGSLYGTALAIVHNLMWSTLFADGNPRPGGALGLRLTDGTLEVLLRAAMALSSIFTGMIVGLIAGLVATAISRAISGAGSNGR
jgi:hypothetical protein